jgi:CheY-like chemotaxis protein
LHVLVVDDNQTSRRILAETLNRWGMRATTVNSGFEALDVLRQLHERGDPPMLVMTDINMPQMDGFELVQRIRQLAAHSETMVIALTSGARAGDTAKCTELDIAAHLVKPVKQSELLNAIMVAIAPISETADGPSAHADVQSAHPALRILLAEDGLANQKLAMGLLQGWGHRVAIANNGREAVDLWASSPFDLVLMDVQMPELDGLDATRTIRQREQQTGGHIPILAMTARAMRGDREECLAAGMDGYISKPVRKQDLYDAIAPFFAQPKKESDHAGSIVGPAVATGVNWDAALHGVGGNTQLLQEVVLAAREELPRLLAELRQAIDEGDAAVVQRAAHSINGSTRLFEFAPVQLLAQQIELMGRSQELRAAPQTLTQLQAAMETLLDDLAAFADAGEDGSP